MRLTDAQREVLELAVGRRRDLPTTSSARKAIRELIGFEMLIEHGKGSERGVRITDAGRRALAAPREPARRED